jgi:transcriptional repressor NrdR
MLCPYCDGDETEAREAIRRRRECASCGRRFTTYEKVEAPLLVVVKRDGSIEPFNEEKILQGLIRACTKRDVPMGRLEALVTDLEAGLRGEGSYEVTSEQVGEMVLERLQDVDLVACVRFASVYRQFESVEEFKDELERLTKVGIR